MSVKNRKTCADVSLHRGDTVAGPLALALEQRFMFDAAGAATAADAAVDRAAQDAADAATASAQDQDGGQDHAQADTTYEIVRAAAPAVNAGRSEVAFVEGNLVDSQALIDALGPGVEIVRLDPSRDGLAQMAEWAETHAGYDAIHVLSHGGEGFVTLGSLSLDTDKVAGRADDLAALGGALTAEGDILLYGCNIAQNHGSAFIDAVAAATGADVAASDDPTGAAALGGDWDLEIATGTIEAGSPFSEAALRDYSHILATESFETFPGATTSFTYDMFGVSFSFSVSGDARIGRYAGYASDGSYSLMCYDNHYTANGAFTIERSGGTADWTLTSFDFDNSAGGAVKVTPYLDGVALTSEAKSVLSQTTGSLSWSNITVDQLVIESNDAQAGNTFFGIDNFTGSATVTPTNNAPTVDIDGGAADGGTTWTAPFVENTDQGTGAGNGVLVTNGTTLGDGDGDGIATIVVTLDDSQGDTGERLLLSGSFTNVMYNLDNDNQITITNAGGATYAQMAAALDAVRYQNNSDAPDTTDRTVSIAVTDDNASPQTTTATTTVTIAAGNDAPTDMALSSASVNQSGGSNATVGTLSTTDPDTGDSATYSLVAGTGDTNNGLFTISGSTLKAVDAASMAAGAYTVRVRTTDGSGATYDEAFSITVVDDVAPTASATVTAISADTGASATDFITKTASQTVSGTFTGTLGTGEKIQVSADGGSTWIDATTSGSTWSATGVTLSSGAGTLSVRTIDAATNTTAGTGHAYTLDTTGPTVTVGHVALSGGSGTSGEYIIGDTVTATWDNSGSGDNNADVETVTMDFSAFGGSASVSATESAGVWTATYTIVSGSLDGVANRNVSVTTTDTAGNQTVVADTDNVTVDNVAPGTASGSLSVAENSANTTTVGTVSASGATAYALTDDAGGRFAINSGTGVVTVADGSLLDYETNASHSITVRTTDAAGNTTDTVLTVTVTDANDAPAIGGLDGDAANYSIGGSAITLDGTPALTVSDVDNTTLASATIQITGQYQSGEDVLGFVNDGGTMGNITGTYDAGTGTLTLTSAGATATTAQWTAALKAVTYNNTDPSTSNTSTRTVTWSVNDGSDSSAAVTTTVSLVRAPIIDLDGDDSSGSTNGGYTGTFTEGGGAVAVADSDSTISDDGTFKSLTVTLTNHPDGTSESLFSTYGTGAQTVNGEAITIGAYNTATGQLTITVDDGSTDAATMQMVIESIRYNNTSEAPDTTARSITFAATDNDDNTGSAATATLTVTAVNDAPTITDGASSTLTATTEDATSSATTVSTLLSSASYADVDSGAASGIAVTGLTGNGTWQYSTDGTTWTAMGTVSGASALLLTSTTQVRYVPDGDNGETATLSYRAWDQSTGTASTNGTPHTANITSAGGTSAFSSGTATASMSVTGLNDAPTVTDGSSHTLTATTEDTSTSSATTVSSLLTGASYADVDSGATSGIAVTGLTGNGTWQYSTDGTTWRAMGTVSESAARLLSSTTQIRYIPDGDNGETATLSYRAWDQTAGTASSNTTPQAADTTTNGGTSAFSSGTATADLSVTAVNDAPTLTDGANLTLTTTTEDATSSATTVSSLLTGASYADVDNSAVSGIAITGLVGNGTWQYSTDGTTWTAMGTVSGSAALLLSSTTQIRYVPDGENGETATLSYRAWDQTAGTASSNGTLRTADTSTHGGTSAFSNGIATATQVVTDVNDAPVASGPLGDAAPQPDTDWSFTVPESLIGDVDTGDTLTWSATTLGGGALPTWLSFDAATRTFTGTAIPTPATQIVVTATDGSGAKASVSFTLTVTAPPEPAAPTPTPTPAPTPPPVISIPAAPPGTESGGQVIGGDTIGPGTEGIGGAGLSSDIGDSGTPVRTAIGNGPQGGANGQVSGVNGGIGSPVVGRLGSSSPIDNSGTPVSQSVSGLAYGAQSALGRGLGASLGGGAFGGGGLGGDLSGGLGAGGGFGLGGGFGTGGGLGGPQTGPATGQGPVTGPEGQAPEPDAQPDATDQQADSSDEPTDSDGSTDSAETTLNPAAPDLAALGASPFTRQLAMAHGLVSPQQGTLAAILAAYQPPDRAA